MRNSLLRNDGHGVFADVTSSSRALERAPPHSLGRLGRLRQRRLARRLRRARRDRRRRSSATTVTARSPTSPPRPASAGSAFSKGSAWGDYDNDGDPDLYVSNYGEPNFFYVNNGNGTFTERAAELGVDRPIMSFPTWFFDYDNDGWLDLFVASFVPSVTEVVRHYRRSAAARGDLQALSEQSAAAASRTSPPRPASRASRRSMGANFGDLDNDGFLDIYLGTGAPSYAAIVPNLMFRNVSGAPLRRRHHRDRHGSPPEGARRRLGGSR